MSKGIDMSHDVYFRIGMIEIQRGHYEIALDVSSIGLLAVFLSYLYYSK